MTKVRPLFNDDDIGRWPVGDIVRMMVTASGLSISDAAERLGINRVNLSHIMGGRKPLSMAMARRLGEAFNVSPYVLARSQFEQEYAAMMATDDKAERQVSYTCNTPNLHRT
jgi:plasmid maintenance system antidote protein VapI